MNDKPVTTNLLNPDIWIRLLYMALTLIFLFIARLLIWILTIFQFLLVLFFGRDNDNLRNFGQGVSKWAYQGLLFLTFNSEDKPFPFSDWPEVVATRPYITTVPETASATSDSEVQSGDEASRDNGDDVSSFTGDSAADEPDPDSTDKR